ncbi:hypothetical protein AC578_6500 [Pseudocercospora eumusae]|uniref:Uncharacterized protein n=1 Tax=Pseudocercospora eumusae TaxID=321146 RepID=A0A139HI45_9PEZI|nr:hypothetical protein AC578_6500 [Pseudocercospora eumusae]
MASSSEENLLLRADKKSLEDESRDLRNDKQGLLDELQNAEYLLRQAREALRKKSEDHDKLLRSSVAVINELDREQMPECISAAVWQLAEDVVRTGGEATGELKMQIGVIDCSLLLK